MILPSLHDKLLSARARKSPPEQAPADSEAALPPPPIQEPLTASDSPASLEAPTSSKVLASSNSPAPLDAPASSDSPAPADAPASSDSPAPSDAPASSDSPAPSDAPASSDSPAPSDAPASSDSPVSSEIPVPSESGSSQQTEQPDPDEDLYEDVDESDFEDPPRRRLVPAETIMILIAVCSFCLFLVTVAFSFPHFFPKDEDPQSLPGYHMDSYTLPPQETVFEPAIEEPENPTIPPDPNPYTRFDFQYNRRNYLLLQNLESYPGVDVSAYQGDIDWQAVADSGIYFAFIRLGYRGYGSGKLVEDSYAKQNLAGAYNAGIKVGAYFFSQALNRQEVDEEIEFMLGVLGEQYLEMPIILDWEIPAADARTSGVMDARTLTDLQLYFCGIMKDKGYQPMVYFNWSQSKNLYYLSDMEEYPFWLAYYNDRMTYPWHVEFWQYSDHGSVPGISGPVDMNVYMPA